MLATWLVDTSLRVVGTGVCIAIIQKKKKTCLGVMCCDVGTDVFTSTCFDCTLLPAGGKC